jgi:hypothetical protein
MTYFNISPMMYVHNVTLAGGAFLAWLNMAKPDDPGLHNLTEAQIIEIFRSEKYHLLSPQPSDFVKATSSTDSAALSKVSVSRANRLYRYKTTQMTVDGNFLTLPHEESDPNLNPRSSSAKPIKIIGRLSITIAWWRILSKAIISGSPDCGKSVEGIFLLNRIFDTYADSPPPILYAASSISTSSLAYFQGFVSFEDSLAYKVMAANGPVWHVYDSTCPGYKERSTAGP